MCVEQKTPIYNIKSVTAHYENAQHTQICWNISMIRLPALVCIFGLVAAVAGCAGVPLSHSEQNAVPSEKIAVLNHGYALLYKKARELAGIHKLLVVKSQSKKTGDMIDALSDFGSNLSKKLEKMVKQYPSLSIEHTGLPKVEKKKRGGVRDYFLEKMAPLVGRTDKAFDRTLLMTQREELNQLRFYASSIASVERSSHRKHMLQRVRQHADKLYKRLQNLLQKQYYSQ